MARNLNMANCWIDSLWSLRLVPQLSATFVKGRPMPMLTGYWLLAAAGCWLLVPGQCSVVGGRQSPSFVANNHQQATTVSKLQEPTLKTNLHFPCPQAKQEASSSLPSSYQVVVLLPATCYLLLLRQLLPPS